MIKLSAPTLLLAAYSAFAQTAPPVPDSPVVHPDRRVTFRFRAPGAKEVVLTREGTPTPMQRDEQGLWSLTTEPLEPDFYGYSFVADGVAMIDPANPLMKPNLLSTQSMVHVPGAGMVWDVANTPRGAVHRHSYHSTVVGDDRDFYVYTPPGYDPKGKTLYPVLYLLHGFSDDARGWTDVGRAHVILDNLIAQHKAKPMLMVMPLGYGAPEVVTRGPRDAALRQKNMDKFREALLGEVIPAVERDYRASKDRSQRAIAGLSMGGAETLYTGLNNPDRFAWIGSFSAGGVGEDFNASFPKLDSKVNDQLRLLWIACGTEDRLIDSNRKFKEWIKSKGVHFTPVETSGAHTWLVWRRNLTEFASLLFVKKAS